MLCSTAAAAGLSPTKTLNQDRFGALGLEGKCRWRVEEEISADLIALSGRRVSGAINANA